MGNNVSEAVYSYLIRNVDQHAIDQYEFGWDGWIETLTFEDKVEVLKDARLVADALKLAQEWVADWCESQSIGAENCALYEENPESYFRYQNNAKLQRLNAKE